MNLAAQDSTPHTRITDARVRSRAGITLIEMLLVVVVVGILLATAAPRFGAAMTRRDVSGASSAFRGLFLEARTAALQTRQAATIRVNSGIAVVTISPGGVLDTIGRPVNFPAEFRLAPTVSSATLRIEPTGLILTGTPFTFTAAKGGISDTVTISGLGRIR